MKGSNYLSFDTRKMFIPLYDYHFGTYNRHIKNPNNEAIKYQIGTLSSSYSADPRYFITTVRKDIFDDNLKDLEKYNFLDKEQYGIDRSDRIQKVFRRKFSDILFVVKEPPAYSKKKGTLTAFGDGRIDLNLPNNLISIIYYWPQKIGDNFRQKGLDVQRLYSIEIFGPSKEEARKAFENAMALCTTGFGDNYFQRLEKYNKKIQEKQLKQKYLHVINKNLPDAKKSNEFLTNESAREKQMQIVNEKYSAYYKAFRDFILKISINNQSNKLLDTMKKIDLDHYDFLCMANSDDPRFASPFFHINGFAGHQFEDFEALIYLSSEGVDLQWKTIQIKDKNFSKKIDYIDIKNLMMYIHKEYLKEKRHKVSYILFLPGVCEKIIDSWGEDMVNLKKTYDELCCATEILGQQKSKSKVIIEKVDKKNTRKIVRNIEHSLGEMDLENF